LPCKERRRLGEGGDVSKASLAGKLAVITGAGRGIGQAIALLFAREGALCALLVRDVKAGEATADAAEKAGTRPEVYRADVTDRDEVLAAARAIREKHRRVDVLVNNAGVLFDEDRATPASRMDPSVFDRTMAVNLSGAVNVSQAFLPAMSKGGRIINVSSTMGQMTGGSAGYAPAYCISKTALNAFTEALAMDSAALGVMVDAFHPGWAKTAMGGPRATVDPMDSAKVALFLATRPATKETGLFWDYSGVIDW